MINEWVKNLKEIGHAPKVNILEYVPLQEDLDGRETYWIQYRLNKGDLLLNDVSVTPLLIDPKFDEITGSSENKEHLIISRFLKEKRKMVNLKQEEFAQRSGVALTVVRKLEQGKTNVTLESLLQILRMYGCTIGIQKNK
jgi:DNA-binding XRE family transcriptional regulator